MMDIIGNIETFDEMKYLMFFKKHDSHYTGYCVFAVNLTKDKLEVEKLKKELSRGLRE